jgi:hypothetical protein
VVVSEDVWRQIRGREGLRFDALGNRSLKGGGVNRSVCRRSRGKSHSVRDFRHGT